MRRLIGRYARWLHTRWPAGLVEKLPEVDEHGMTAVPGLYVVGDLTGIPLLKFSADTGARAVAHILEEADFSRPRGAEREELLDLAIVGAGVSGMSAALEARRAGLSFAVFEASEPFSTILNFPKGKPIYTYPTDMEPAGQMRFTAEVKEPLVDELRAQTLEQGIEVRRARVEQVRKVGERFELAIPEGESLQARRVIVAIGRSGNFRRLGVPGEDLDKVYNRLHDPRDFADRDVLVVGGGDSALETAISIAESGGRVILSYRRPEFARPKPDNVEKIRRLSTAPEAAVELLMASRVERIEADRVIIEDADGQKLERANDAVFAMIGREAPLDFFRRSRVAIRGEWRPSTWVSFALIMLAALFLYHWKTDAGIPVKHWFQQAELFPFNLERPADPASLWGTIRLSMTQPSFYYSLAYCLAVITFGIRRIRRRRTQYVTAQTTALILIQCIPLFLLPYILLPWAGHNGWFADGSLLQPLADALFPRSEWAEHGREYWRSLGLILAWPLFFWNVFTAQPMWTWLAISLVQTFLLVPLIVRRWGKGAYCGWICSCGALAETMGDAHRHKMPHGPLWNRVNMVGQGVLLLAFLILILRLVGWLLPYDHWVNALYMGIFMGKDVDWGNLPFPLSFLNYVWSVDLLMAGIIGVGFYWHFSGRVWCRFGCPLAALMHIYARFSRFRILADKKKCISCNVCTSVCHQGIDVMNFANKGLPMADPQCVRCSACVQSCPTGVLEFGRIDPDSGSELGRDRLTASPVRAREVR